jgi:hypothetical protein
MSTNRFHRIRPSTLRDDRAITSAVCLGCLMISPVLSISGISKITVPAARIG